MRTLIALAVFASTVATADSRYEEALRRLDAMRSYIDSGGSPERAREEAAEIARRDGPLGRAAAGYIAYRSKQYAAARRELREAAKTATKSSTRILALSWLGSLSQENGQYGEAFYAFEKILEVDPLQLAASYEIGRTSVLCRCRVERGDEALVRYLASTPIGDMPTIEQAEKLRDELRAISPSGDRRPAP